MGLATSLSRCLWCHLGQAMSVETRNWSGFTSPAFQSAIIENEAARPKPVKATRLAVVRRKIMATEFLAVAASAYIASLIYHGALMFALPPATQYVYSALFIAAMVSLVSAGFQHFTASAIQMRPLHVLLWNGIGAVGIAFMSLLSAIFLLKISEDYSRGTFIFQVVCVCVAVIAVRMISYSRVRSAIASGAIEARHVVLIGDATRCAQFSDRLRADGIQSVATFRAPWNQVVATESDGAYPEGRTVRKLIEACRAILPDDIIVLATEEELPKTMSLASSLSELPVGLHIVPVDAIEMLAGSHIAEFGSLLTLQVHRPPLSSFDLAVKRIFDVIAAGAGLIVLSPLLLTVSIAIKLDSRGPVFFRQTRHGFNNEPIRVLKFRSMTTLEDGDQFKQVVKDDPRVTRIGRMLRRTNIDELPQLVNVFHGDMSIVGPRPHATAQNAFFQTKIAPFSRRHIVKPGITGWAQVNGFRGETDTLEKMQQRVEHDLYYIDNQVVLLPLT